MAGKTVDELTNIAVRNQALLEATKRGLFLDFGKQLAKLKKQINDAILTAEDVQTSKAVANGIKSQINEIQKEFYAAYVERFNKDVADIGYSQAEIEANSYAQVVVDYKPVVPTIEQVITAYSVNPLQVENYAGDPLFDKYIKKWSDGQRQLINKSISDGFNQGLTNSQITQRINGTKSLKYKDGLLNNVENASRSMIRTAVQHVAMQSQQATMKKNSDLVEGYKIVVTFDSRTTTLCMDIGQQNKTYEVGKGLMPPLHWGCRDTIVAALNSKYDFLDEGRTRASKGAEGGQQVDAKLGSYDWMLTQPKAFQEMSLGKTRATLLRDGGLTPTEFANLSTNHNGAVLTIEQMKSKAPLVFERAGL